MRNFGSVWPIADNKLLVTTSMNWRLDIRKCLELGSISPVSSYCEAVNIYWQLRAAVRPAGHMPHREAAAAVNAALAAFLRDND